MIRPVNLAAFLLLITLPLTALRCFTIAAAASALNLRGISPEDESYFKSDIIWCKDGSKSFIAERLNDDFCDCADGTDEPGTSACPNGRFYCKNRGHTPLLIFSSRVNDGICDCCDGSDEYDGRSRCVNTCSEAGKVLREKLEKKIVTFKEGLEIRKRDVAHAKDMIQKEKMELSTLKQDEKKLKDLVQKLKAKKEVIDKAEMQEKLDQEKEEQKRKEAEKQERNEEPAETKNSQETENSGDLDDHTNPTEEIGLQEEMEKGSSEAMVAESMSKEELGRLVASRWTGEDPTLESRDAINAEEDHEMDSEDEVHHDDYPHADDEQEGEDSSEDEDEDEDSENEYADAYNEATLGSVSTDSQDVEASEGSWLWVKLREAFMTFSGFYKFSSLPFDRSEANHVRKEYEKSTSKLSEIQSRISDLEKKLEQDFGKHGEFYSFYGQCFEERQKKYTYKICPYRNGLQLEGHSTTTLGNWDGFKDDYKSMQFVRGDKCWNGPDRSLKVKLRCGIKVELRDVDEPSRCEYVAELSTPAACLEERLAALQQRLGNRGEVPHDEL